MEKGTRMDSKDYGFCYRIAFECIGKENGIERMIHEIADRVGATVIITNIYGEIVSECDILHLRNRKEHYDKMIRSLILKELEQEERKEELEELSEAVMRPIEVKHNIEGFVVVLFPDSEEKENWREIVHVIAKTVAIELEYHKDRTWCSISMERQIVSEIVLGGKKEMGEDIHIKEKMEQNYLIPGFLLGIVWSGDHRRYGQLQHIRNQIYEKDQDLLSYLSGECLYLLFTGKKEEQKTTELLRAISQASEVQVCVGSLFSDKEEILSRKRFLEQAMQTGNRMDPEREFFVVKENFLETICSYVVKESGFKGYYCEELERLRKEDLQKGTEFYRSLKQYLLSGNNVGMAAKKLFVHRNTMIYRLQKIDEIMKIDPNEPDTARLLLISMVLQELIDKSNKKVDEERNLR